jgi:hypothetical protein
MFYCLETLFRKNLYDKYFIEMRIIPDGASGTTGKIVVAVPAIIAVSLCTAKKSLPCAENMTHGKHKAHGKYLEQRTAMKDSTA